MVVLGETVLKLLVCLPGFSPKDEVDQPRVLQAADRTHRTHV